MQRPGNDVRGQETMFVDHYLKPLGAAGITASVVRTCRLAAPDDVPWNLSVQVRLDAPQTRVADVLAKEDIVIRRDRQPMIVQQVFDGPDEGWDGILSATGEKSTLTLQRGNVEHSGYADALGWGEVCPDSPES